MKIKIFLYAPKGKILCMCKGTRKLCNRKCERASVEYDQYEGIEACFKVNRYGK